MKAKILFLILTFLMVNSSLCQIRVHYKDVQVNKNGDIIATVIAQNIGSRTHFIVRYGARWQMTRLDDKDKEFSIKYKHIPSGRDYKEIPSSVTVKSIYGQYMEMEHSYEMPSTGTSGETWRVMFTNIPLEAENVKIDILGWEYSIGDLSLADKARYQRDEKVNNLIAEGNKFQNRNDYKDAIVSYTEAIKLDNSKYKELSPKVSLGFFNLAEIDFENNEYESAIENYELCLNADKSRRAEISANYAEALFQEADSYYSQSDYVLASDVFAKAINIDNSIKDKVDSRFNSIRMSQLPNVALSSLPGIMQLYRSKNTSEKVSQVFSGSFSPDNLDVLNGLIMIGSFSVCSVISYSSYNNADDYYDKYLSATSEQDAGDYYEQTISAQKTALIASTISIGAVLWSIYDSYKWVNWHNYMFTLNNKKYSAAILPIVTQDRVAVNFALEF
ncbi:MAG: tetratricopeptide repeat protein [Candidatus Brocadiales bacterium]|nr:tetratricopeptide repeat protein [Candidatus Brocadiales bacterium]